MKRKTCLALSALFVGGLMTMPAAAAPIAIGDNSFESSTSSSNTFASPSWTGNVAKWALVVDVDSSANFANDPTAGTKSLTLDSRSDDDVVTSGVYQSVGVIEANTVYTLDFEVGRRRLTVLPQDFTAGLFAGAGATPTTGLATKSLGDMAFSSTDTTLANPVRESHTVIFDSSTPAGSLFVGQNLFINIKSNEIQNSDVKQVYFDNFELDGSLIPEPASLALLGLGGLCMLARRRKA